MNTLNPELHLILGLQNGSTYSWDIAGHFDTTRPTSEDSAHPLKDEAKEESQNHWEAEPVAKLRICIHLVLNGDELWWTINKNATVKIF